MTVKELKNCIERLKNVHNFDDSAQIRIERDAITGREGFASVSFKENDVEIVLRGKIYAD
jgi:hypothetical protein